MVHCQGYFDWTQMASVGGAAETICFGAANRNASDWVKSLEDHEAGRRSPSVLARMTWAGWHGIRSTCDTPSLFQTYGIDCKISFIFYCEKMIETIFPTLQLIRPRFLIH